MINFNDIKNQESFPEYIVKKEMDDFLSITTDLMTNYEQLDFVNGYNLYGTSQIIETDYENRQITFTNEYNVHDLKIITFLGGYEITVEYKPNFDLYIKNIQDCNQSKNHAKFKVKQIVTKFVHINTEGVAWNLVNNNDIKILLGKIKTDGIEIRNLRFVNVDVFINWCKKLFKNNKDCTITIRKSYFEDLFDGYLEDRTKFNNLFKLTIPTPGLYQIHKKEKSVNEDFNFNNIHDEESLASKALSRYVDIQKFLEMYKFSKTFYEPYQKFRNMLNLIFGTVVSMHKIDTTHTNEGYLKINTGHTECQIVFLGGRKIVLKTNKSIHLTNEFLQYNANPNPIFKVVEVNSGNHITRIGSALVDSEIVTSKMIKRMPKITNTWVYHVGFSEKQNIHFDVIKTLYDMCSENPDFLTFDIPKELFNKYESKIHTYFRHSFVPNDISPNRVFFIKLYKK